MFCPNCGTQNADGAAFCQNCGTPLVNEAPAAPVTTPEEPTYQPPEQQYTAPETQYQPPVQQYAQLNYQQPAPAPVLAEDPPAVAALKKVAASVPFLVATILYTLGALASFIGSLIVTKGSAYIVRIGNYTYRVSFSGGGFSASAVTSLVPSVVIALALWLIYFAAKRRGGGFSTGGLVIHKVFLIISAVGVALGGVAVSVALIIGGIVSGDLLSLLNEIGIKESLDSGIVELITKTSPAAYIVVVCVLIAVFVFAFVFILKLIKSVNTAKRVAETGIPSDKVSPFAGVVLYISAFFCAVSAVSLIVMGLVVSGIAALVSAVATGLFAATLFSFRKAMRAEMAKGGAQYGQAPYGGDQVVGVQCPRCGGVFASNLTACPYCGLQR